jgi:hypothetical protein
MTTPTDTSLTALAMIGKRSGQPAPPSAKRKRAAAA